MAAAPAPVAEAPVKEEKKEEEEEEDETKKEEEAMEGLGALFG
jgi:large subunit ribosomal protein L12